MSVTIVTTFGPKQYDEYAKYFVDSAIKFIHTDIKVVLYTDVPMTFAKQNFENRILNDCCPNLVEFKKRNQHKTIPQKTKGWLYDAVRFSHKSYCIIDAARKCNTDYLIWLDADTEIIAPITKEYLISHIPTQHFVSFLGRDGRYSETGWLGFDIRNKWTQKYFNKWEWYYNTDEIYNLPAQLDCHVFDEVTKQFLVQGKIKAANISPSKITKQHFNQTFVGYLTHYKGNDKQDRKFNYKAALNRAKKHETSINRA